MTLEEFLQQLHVNVRDYYGWRDYQLVVMGDRNEYKFVSWSIDTTEKKIQITIEEEG